MSSTTPPSTLIPTLPPQILHMHIVMIFPASTRHVQMRNGEILSFSLSLTHTHAHIVSLSLSQDIQRGGLKCAQPKNLRQNFNAQLNLKMAASFRKTKYLSSSKLATLKFSSWKEGPNPNSKSCKVRGTCLLYR